MKKMLHRLLYILLWIINSAPIAIGHGFDSHKGNVTSDVSALHATKGGVQTDLLCPGWYFTY